MGAISALGEWHHRRKMKPLHEDLKPPSTPAAVAARELSLTAWADAGVLLDALSAQSPRADTFATWMLALVGGSATLIVSNFNSITAEMPRLYVSYGLYLLRFSTLLGLAEKWLALRIQIATEAALTVTATLKELDKEDPQRAKEQVKLVDVFDQIVRAYPWWAKRRIVKVLVKALGDPLFASRSNARLTFWQLGLIGGQLLLFVLFIFLMGKGVAS